MSAVAKRKERYYTAEDYFSQPDGSRAELLDGVLYDMATPTRVHQRIIGLMVRYIWEYIEKSHKDCEAYPAPFTVKLDKDKENYVEPDISVICDKDKLKDWGCEGAPDWIVEVISPSNASHDCIKKLNYYFDAGVREYWLVDPMKEMITVHIFEGGEVSDYNVYSFKDKVPVAICEGFTIDFAKLA